MKNLLDTFIRSRAFMSLEKTNLTNASFKWQPDANLLSSASGFSSVIVSLCSRNKSYNVNVMVQRTGKSLSALFVYDTSTSGHDTIRIPLPLDQAVHLELDINPKTSNVVYWVNDKGMDMGVLPGFKGGAEEAYWTVCGFHGHDMMFGKMLDCAFATSEGWQATSFRPNRLNLDNLHKDHLVEILDNNSINFGNQPS